MKTAKFLIIGLACVMAYLLSQWCIEYDHYELLLLNIPLFGIIICGLISSLADKISQFLDTEN
jgi:predicted CDP-diglyceride synthetase/phosphatidate cytidylyltransferase